MKQPMRTECYICNESKYMPPCWSLSACTAYICKECETKNNKGKDKEEADKCIYCRNIISRLDIIIDIECKNHKLLEYDNN
jgi:hypothetical protein